MPLTKADKEIVKRIDRVRMTCLIHRYLYYVKNDTLVSDQKYDSWERELNELVAKHPQLAHEARYSLMCPTKTVGSSNLEDYPREVEQIAESLLAYARRKEQDASSSENRPES